MERLENIYEKIISLDNLIIAAKKAAKNKKHRRAVKKFFRENGEDNVLLKQLHESLKKKTFVVGKYKKFKVYEPKERTIFKLPFFPDRIVQHAIVNILGDYWYSLMRRNTYACVKDRGMTGEQGMYTTIVLTLKANPKGTQYCLKQDIRHYYPSIPHDKMKEVLSEGIADKDALWLLCMYIDSISTGDVEGVGLPIGSILSQYFANLFLSKFDYDIEKKLSKKYHISLYARYNDDKIFLAKTKEQLHQLFEEERKMLLDRGLKLKPNYQIFPVEARGIDIGGFVFRHNYILIRKNIKKNFCRKVAELEKRPVPLTIDEYKQEVCPWLGYIQRTNSRHLIEKVVPKEYQQIFDKYLKLDKRDEVYNIKNREERVFSKTADVA
ncbi:MAG: RNA-directed DNA polymerase [Bacteroidales bacterium]|nr:RNA-directed DNA polymerase [Bacteroidales bacterium]